MMSFLENVRQEVIDNIIRIRNHACVAMYCGNNENEVGWEQWGWKEKIQQQSNSASLSRMRKSYFTK